MAFWIAAGLLTFVALVAVAVPLLRRPREAHAQIEYDREVYRARLAEIETDRKVGRLSAEEAEAAEAEEGRRLITLAEGPQATSASARPSRLAIFCLIAMCVGVPGITVLTYLTRGAPEMPDMAAASRTMENPQDQTLTQLLERAEAQLARRPDDVQGWKVVAPVYLRLGRVDDAIAAWRNAVRLEPDNPDLKSSLAEAIVTGAAGVVTEEARSLFEQAHEQRPGDAKSRFYLAIALTQEGRNTEAVEAWRTLIGDAPPQAPWLEAARSQLSLAAERAGVELVEEADRTTAQAGSAGPSREDIEAAQQMSAEDRAQMIETMVAGLAERLSENPDDKQGWRRLIRSYTVLNRKDDATAAIASAREHFAGDGAFLEELAQIERSLDAPQARPAPEGNDQ